MNLIIIGVLAVIVIGALVEGITNHYQETTMATSPLFTFDVRSDQWGIAFDELGELITLVKLENDRWRWKGFTHETFALERGDVTLREFLEAFITKSIAKLKELYGDDEPVLDTWQKKLRYALEHSFEYDDATLTLSLKDNVPE